MGKVTVIIQSSSMDTTALEVFVHRTFDEEHTLAKELVEIGEVFIVPADEEWPDLS